MELNVAQELARLRRMTPAELRDQYRETFGESTRSGHKNWLIKRIIWRLQALAEGDLSERALRRATELANDADLRTSAPRPPQSKTSRPPVLVPNIIQASADDRLPMPGTVMTRLYKGEIHQVQVLNAGFEHEGRVYRSLSAVAKAITGTHTNGYLFFRMGKYGGAE